MNKKQKVKDNKKYRENKKRKGKKGLKIEPPLYAHNNDGSYSDEIKKMFGEEINE